MIVSCVECGRKIAVPEDMPCPMSGFRCGGCAKKEQNAVEWHEKIRDVQDNLPTSTRKVCPTCKGSGVVSKGDDNGDDQGNSRECGE